MKLYSSICIVQCSRFLTYNNVVLAQIKGDGMQDKLNRREFLKKASMATVAGTTGFLVGCNTGQPTVESAPATSAPAATEAPADSSAATSAPAATAEEVAEAIGS